MKYRVKLTAKKISDPDCTIKLTAVSAVNAKEIAEMKYKNYIAVEAVRLGNQPSTVQFMEEIKESFVAAMDEGNKELASRHEKAFYATMASLQGSMDVVAFNMAKKHLPSLPPLGK